MSAELTAEQKIRQTVTGSPVGEPHFQHEEGDQQIVRWLTGGSLPDAWVTFHPQEDKITVRCAGCRTVLGYLPGDYEKDETAKQILAIRLAGHELHNPLTGSSS